MQAMKVAASIVALIFSGCASAEEERLVTCASARTPLTLKGFLKDGRNRPVLTSGRPTPSNHQIDRPNCERPVGQWRRDPAPLSSSRRSCGPIFDRLGRKLSVPATCRLLSYSPKIANFATEAGAGSCASQAGHLQKPLANGGLI